MLSIDPDFLWFSRPFEGLAVVNIFVIGFSFEDLGVVTSMLPGNECADLSNENWDLEEGEPGSRIPF
jgi:hypothetical protein